MNLKAHPRLLREHWPQIAEIDNSRFGINDYNDTFVKNAENHSDSYTVLTLDGKILGYGLVVPTTSFAQEAIKRGEMDESELLRNFVVSRGKSDALYIASIATRKDTKPILSSRLVGYVGGSVLRSDKPIFAVTISDAGEQLAYELSMVPSNYQGPFSGLNNHAPKYFEKPAFGDN